MATIAPDCAGCGNGEMRGVLPGTILDPDAAPEGYFGSFRTKTGYFPIVRCAQCGLLQMRPHDDDATLARAYGALAADTEHELDAAARRLARSQVRFVERRSPAPSRLLDAGAGAGCFVEAAVLAGYEVTAIEPSSECARIIRERVPAARVLEASIDGADVAPQSFDVITLWDVLEHVPEPRSTLERLMHLIRPGGWLLLQVPDAGSIAARLLGKRWPLYLREHLTYFDAPTISRLLESVGYRVELVRPSVRYFPLRHLLRRMRQMGLPLPEPPVRQAKTDGAFSIADPVLAAPVGEMRVVAQRPA